VRILVTRPRGQAEATARRLAALGHEPVLAPVLEIVPTGEAPPGGPCAAVLLTSQNAVPALAAERARFGATPIFAVGTRTAEAARRSGFGIVEEAGGDGLALLAYVRDRLPAGAQLLHAAGRDRKAEPARSLILAGYAVATWECYGARPVAALPDDAVAMLRDGQIGAVLHYSRRSAELFCRLARLSGLGEALAGMAHLCLSPDVARGLDSLAGLKLRIAATPDEPALLRLLPEAGLAPGSRLPQSGC
jgi:uroporphyrinogen-III synthase